MPMRPFSVGEDITCYLLRLKVVCFVDCSVRSKAVVWTSHSIHTRSTPHCHWYVSPGWC